MLFFGFFYYLCIMNIKIITSFFKRYWPLGLIILWAAGCWAFFQFCYPYHFFYKEQNQIFLWTADYLQSYNGPGWLARLTGDFFTQFYYYIFAGAAILTAILLLLGDIIRRIFQNLGCGKWAYLVGIAAMTIEAWRHFYYDYSLSSTISLIGYAILFWLCSTVFKKRKILACALLALLLFPGWLLFGKPEAGKFTSPEWQLEKLLAVDNEYNWGNYGRVKQLVENDTNRTPYTVFLYNLAQAQKGELPDNLLKITPIEMGTLWQIGPEAPLLEIKMINELYYVLGDVTYAERAAMMGNVFAPGNRNVRMIKRLAECNLISGDQPAANKYLGILKKTYAYRNWAEKGSLYACLSGEGAVYQQERHHTPRRLRPHNPAGTARQQSPKPGGARLSAMHRPHHGRHRQFQIRLRPLLHGSECTPHQTALSTGVAHLYGWHTGHERGNPQIRQGHEATL